MKKITLLLTIVFLWSFGGYAQMLTGTNNSELSDPGKIQSSQVANKPTVSLEMQDQIQETYVSLGNAATPVPLAGSVNLNSAANFGILAGAGITSIGFSIITDGDVGISPGIRGGITGFPPAIVVNGEIYASDDPGAVPAMLEQAKLDLQNAYLFAEGASVPAPTTVAGNLGGLTLAPGIYKSTSTLLIQASDLTLDAQGDPNASWIFQIASGLTTIGGATGGNVILANGAQAENITWQVGSSATIGNNTSFAGNILAYTSITMNTGSEIDGRLLAMGGAVILSGTNMINVPLPSSSDPCEDLDLTVHTGNGVWSNGVPDITKNAVFDADYDTTPFGSIDAGCIEINPGVTVTISESTTIRAEYSIIINGDLIFLSSVDGDGELAVMGADATITGDATIHRYMSENRAFRMVSSAVTTTTTIRDNWQEGVNNPDINTNLDPNPGFGTHITESDPNRGFDPTQTGNPSMYWIEDAPAQQFTPIDNTNQYTLNAGDAYLLFVRGDRSINLNDPTNTDFKETILRTKGIPFHGDKFEKFEGMEDGDFIMFGNPYQSVLDADAVINDIDNANTNHYYIYDPTLGTHGAYVIVNLADGGNNTYDSEANQYIQPGQAAQYTTISSGDSYLTIREDHKAPGQHTQTSVQGHSNDNMLTVQLYTAENFNNGGPVHDSFGMIFDESFDNAITHQDAVMPLNFYENLGIDHNGTYLGLERRQMPQEGEIFQLYSNGYSYSDYTLKLIVDGLEDTALFLEDHFTGESTLLGEGEIAYHFVADQNDPLSLATDRFTIRVEGRLGIGDNTMSSISLYPNPASDNIFYINAPQLNGQSVDVTISDLSGRTVYTETLNFKTNKITVSTTGNLASGVYMVTMEHAGEVHTFKLVKE